MPATRKHFPPPPAKSFSTAGPTETLTVTRTCSPCPWSLSLSLLPSQSSGHGIAYPLLRSFQSFTAATRDRQGPVVPFYREGS